MMAMLQLLLLVLCFVSIVSGQCSADTCTQQCIPNQWERDLCQFYQEIATWHATAVECGLNVDPIPQSRPSSPEQQWEQVRLYWEHLRAVWKVAATENGVFGSQDLPNVSPSSPMATTTPPTTANEILTPFPTEMGSGFTSASGLGSGIQPTTEIPTDPPTEVSTTSPPPTSNVPLTQQDMWLSGVHSWENEFAQWERFARSESGLHLPESTSGDIIGRIVTEGGSNNERVNSAIWFELLTDWNGGFTVYNSTFSGSCPDFRY